MKKILLALSIMVTSYAAVYASVVKNPTPVSPLSEVLVDCNFKMNFYPNPCPRVLNIEIQFDKIGASSIEIHMRNLIGKEVVTAIKETSFEQNNRFEFDMSELPAGIYLMEVITYNNGVASKMMKRVTKV
jgi:hypothetical protein